MEKMAKAGVIAFFIAFFDLGMLLLGTTSVAVGGVGLVTFLGVLMLANFLSESSNLDKGEVRKAITASCFAVYFAITGLLLEARSTAPTALTAPTAQGTTETELAKTIVAHLTYLVGIIVAFYFGSRSVEKYLENLKGAG